jgi:protein gp37
VSDGTHIEWTDATWNPITGCAVVSPGCTNCYAMKLAGTRLRHHPSRAGLTRDTKAGPVWTGEVRFNEQWLLDPLRWTKPRRIFVCAHADLFGEAVPDEWIDRIFAVMALAPQHQFQVLTKRAERMRAYLSNTGDMGICHGSPRRIWQAMYGEAKTPIAAGVLDSWYGGPTKRQWPLPNVWLGVSVEDQVRADERIPHLLAAPAAVRWLSCEPLLGPVDLTSVSMAAAEAMEQEPSGLVEVDALTGIHYDSEGEVSGIWGDPDPKIDWIVAGGESGPGARPMHPDWARSLRDQCAAAGVPFLFKQWGEFGPVVTTGHGDPRYPPDPPTGWRMERLGKKNAGRLLDGVQHDGFPA